MYPGWNVRVNGKPADASTFESMYRGVEVPPGTNTIVWTYRPHSVHWGALASIVTLLLLAGVAHVRFWHPQRLRWFDLR
jgi:uncharacterized membrane protein YfhO